MNNSELELRIKRLERKLCCKLRFLDTFGDFPAEGQTGVLYIDNSTGDVYIWNGSEFVSSSISALANEGTFLERQKIESYYENPTIPLTVDAVQFERYLDAKYFYVPNSDEHRIYFLSIPSLGGGHQYRYSYSLDGGKTWDFDPSTPHYFQALGSGDEIGLHEHFILPIDATNWNMYYQAYDGLGIYRTKLATTTDAGLTWTRQGVVLNVGAVGQWDSNYAGIRNVIVLNDGTYYAAYEGNNGGMMKGGAATSVDGITWVKIGMVVETESGLYPWEGDAGLINYVQYVDDTFVMMYGTKQLSAFVQNTNRYIGLAYSKDGINYEKYTENPTINLSEFLVDVPGSWNYGTEDFIAWDKIPGKEGAYTIITRGRPVYTGSGGMEWNFGLYWFGNRLAPNDIEDVTFGSNILTVVKRLGTDFILDLSSILFTNTDVWYVNVNGDNLTAQKGDFFKQAADPFYVSNALAAANDIIEIISGASFTAGTSVPFDAGNFNNHTLSKTDGLLIKANEKVTFTLPANSDQSFWLIGDIEVFGTSNGARVFKMIGKPNIFVTRSGAGISIPITFYDELSKLDLELGRVELIGGGRNWLMQNGCPLVNVSVDYLEVSGSVGYWQANPISYTGVKRNVDVSFNTAIADGNTDGNSGLIRMTLNSDTDGVFNFRVRDFLSRGNTNNSGVFSCEGTYTNSVINFIAGDVRQLVAGTVVNSYYGTSVSALSASVTSLTSLVLTNSIMNIEIDYVNTPNTFHAGFLSSLFQLNNSTLIIKIKEGRFTGSAPFVLKNFSLTNNSKIIIDCENCICAAGQSAFWIFDNTIDGTSAIEITGRYVCSAVVVINTRDKVVLNNCTMITSGTAAVESNAATEVVIKSAYTNSILVSGNITEVAGTIIKDASIR